MGARRTSGGTGATRSGNARPSDPAGLFESLQHWLAERIRSGDDDAEERLVRLYFDRVLTSLSRRLHDREAAREVADDVLMTVVAALRAGKVRDVERLDAFVMGTTRNLANNHLRRRRRAPRFEAITKEPAAADSHQERGHDERLERLRQEVARLEPLDREILELTLGEGLKSGEIALRTGHPAAAVRQRKHRAIERLIRRLAAPAN